MRAGEPVCSQYTHASHIADAKSGTERICFNVSIHAPGRGIFFASPGSADNNTYGNAIPRPRAANIEKVKAAEASDASAAPTAAPMNGAVQGLATKTARTPESAAEAYLLRLFSEEIPPANPAPISNAPAKLSAIAKNSRAIAAENTGF